jgi:hypothetical protein
MGVDNTAEASAAGTVRRDDRSRLLSGCHGALFPEAHPVLVTGFFFVLRKRLPSVRRLEKGKSYTFSWSISGLPLQPVARRTLHGTRLRVLSRARESCSI